jgi:riboflavin transporter FmnP
MEKTDLNSGKNSNKFSVRSMTMTALLGGLSYLTLLIRFPLPFMPPFMDFDFAGVPELVGIFILGPVYGFFIIAIKLAIKIATTGTASALTGELINMMLSCSFVFPAWFVYSRKRDRRHALYGMIAGVLTATAVACFSNVYLIIPLYARLYGYTMDMVIASTQLVNKYIDSVPRLVLIGIMPFNLFKLSVSSFIVYALYDRVMHMYERLTSR